LGNLFELAGALSLCAWIYLLLARGGFWRVRETAEPPLRGTPGSVAVVIPARNEEAVVAQSVGSLLKQNYPGALHVFLVDDHSTDATVQAAGIHERLTIVEAGPLPPGWTGKLRALSEGLKHAEAMRPDYILLTDADIVHSPGNLVSLVARAEVADLDLASYMVKLKCDAPAERALIPAFVFFFFMLYPPAWIARRERSTAGAAGGCILIRPRALARIGGIAAIRNELIDDCALARKVKSGGAIWLGVTSQAHSIREYASFAEIRSMIARTAFTQLRHSTLLLIATLSGIAAIYVAPPLLLFTRYWALGLAAWILMAIAYIPTLRLYRRSLLWAPVLPLVALFYMAATLDSAVQYWSGRGGAWKGRIQDVR